LFIPAAEWNSRFLVAFGSLENQALSRKESYKLLL
jgi:hypothetical protein